MVLMVVAIIIGVVLVALLVGYWLTRNARGASQTEIIDEEVHELASVDAAGEPMEWEKSERPPDY